MCLVIVSSMDIVAVKNILYLQACIHLLPHSPHLFSCSTEFRYKVPQSNETERLSASDKSTQESRCFLMGVKKMKLTRVPCKLYDILKVKDAVMKPVQCVTERTICSLAVCTYGYATVVKICRMQPILLVDDFQL